MKAGTAITLAMQEQWRRDMVPMIYPSWVTWMDTLMRRHYHVEELLNDVEPLLNLVRERVKRPLYEGESR